MPNHRTATVVETHVSTVFFTADRAYKLLKSVDFGFLDFTDTATRVAAAGTELELNRRLAPDVYLGLADVVEHGELVDRMIVMRRLPADRRLSALVGGSRFDDCLRAVARRVAVFHAAQPPHPLGSEVAGPDAVRRNWDDNLAVLRRADGAGVPQAVERIEQLAHRFLDSRRPLFEERVGDGMVRDGHGDLLADDIFCLDDGPRILDCLAFAESLRVADVLLDIAFLAMDVDRLAGPEAAATLLAAYQELADEHHPELLAHHYVAYRAGVRAKVAQLRSEQGDDAGDDVATHVELCLRHLEAGQVRLVLVGGGAGVGKSTLALDLAAALRCTALSTDEIRREAAGLAPGEHAFAPPGEGLYERARVDAVYRSMLGQTRMLLERGETVVLDASWTFAAHRDEARALAVEAGAELTEIECRLAPALAKERIARRLASPDVPSDATPEVVDHQASVKDPWPEAVPADMTLPPTEIAAAMYQMIRGG
jgi:aminoglycoside phosphotransferase family enzyme/predicted kinase